MDKNDIIEYVMHTPHNTNRAVLSSMLDSLDSGIEMVTFFDDDIDVTNYNPSTQYGPANAGGFGVFSNPGTEDGIVKVTYENKSTFGVYTIASNGSGFSLSVYLTINESPVYNLHIADYDSPNSFVFRLTCLNRDVESEFEAYCQEPHPLKVEWFTI